MGSRGINGKEEKGVLEGSGNVQHTCEGVEGMVCKWEGKWQHVQWGVGWGRGGGVWGMGLSCI